MGVTTGLVPMMLLSEHSDILASPAHASQIVAATGVRKSQSSGMTY